MARYLVLIYGDEQKWAEASPEWHAENGERHGAFNAAVRAAVLDGGELARTAEAITVRSGGAGRPRATDGPFIETKEVVGGFYLLEAADLAEATALAAQIPEASAPFSGVEIRAIAT